MRTTVPTQDPVVAGSPCDGAGDAFRMFLLDEAALQARQRGHDVIQLTLGICDLPLRREILDAINSASRDPAVSRRVCPAGLPELREALSRHYEQVCDACVPADRILVDAGTSSIFRNLLEILTQPGDEVLIPMPYYPLYRFSAMLAAAECRHYNICLDTMRVDIDSLARGITERTRLVVLNSPGNPLGNVVSSSDLVEFIAVIPPHVYLIVDEVYDNVRFRDDGRLLASQLLPDLARQARLVITNSFSKGYRMYTRRVGWCVLPEDLVRPMTVIQQHTRLTVDPAVQLGAVEALKYPQDVVEVLSTNRDRWEHARRRLTEVDCIRLLPTYGGFYCVLDCRRFIAGRGFPHCLGLAFDILEQARVATVPGADFGLPGMLRLSFTSARFVEAIDRLCSYFSGHVGSKTT